MHTTISLRPYLHALICRNGDLPLIVAIDLQPMAPIEGVIQVQGDITNARTAEVVSIAITPQFLALQPFRLRNLPD